MNNKQVRFLEALFKEPTITKAAKAAGISRTTAYRYLDNEEFSKELNKKRSECMTDAVRYMQSKLTMCAETLVDIVENPTKGAQVKINAINAIFTNFKALEETTELLQKMAELEAEQEALNRKLGD